MISWIIGNDGNLAVLRNFNDEIAAPWRGSRLRPAAISSISSTIPTRQTPTLAILGDYIQRCYEIKLLGCEPRGVGNALNVATGAATGDMFKLPKSIRRAVHTQLKERVFPLWVYDPKKRSYLALKTLFKKIADMRALLNMRML